MAVLRLCWAAGMSVVRKLCFPFAFPPIRKRATLKCTALHSGRRARQLATCSTESRHGTIQDIAAQLSLISLSTARAAQVEGNGKRPVRDSRNVKLDPLDSDMNTTDTNTERFATNKFAFRPSRRSLWLMRFL